MKLILKRNLSALFVVIMILAACLFIEWAAFHIPALLFVVSFMFLVLFIATEKGFRNKTNVLDSRKQEDV